MNTESINEVIAKRLRAVIKINNVNISHLAIKSGVSRGTITNYMNLKRQPTLCMLADIANGLGVPISFLLGEGNENLNINEGKNVQQLLFNILQLTKKLNFDISTQTGGNITLKTNNRHIADFLKMCQDKTDDEIYEILKLYENYVVINGEICSSSNDPQAERHLLYNISEADHELYPEECRAELQRRIDIWNSSTTEGRKKLLEEIKSEKDD